MDVRDPFKTPLSAPPVERSDEDRIWEGEAHPPNPSDLLAATPADLPLTEAQFLELINPSTRH